MAGLTLSKIKEVKEKFKEIGKSEPLYMVIHPMTYYKIKVQKARDDYKTAQHNRRYAEWLTTQKG